MKGVNLLYPLQSPQTAPAQASQIPLSKLFRLIHDFAPFH